MRLPDRSLLQPVWTYSTVPVVNKNRVQTGYAKHLVKAAMELFGPTRRINLLADASQRRTTFPLMQNPFLRQDVRVLNGCVISEFRNNFDSAQYTPPVEPALSQAADEEPDADTTFEVNIF